MNEVMAQTSQVLPVVVGVDIGGTNTDAVLVHSDDRGQGHYQILSEVKELTTSDVIEGVRRAVLRCLVQAKDNGLSVVPIQVNIGTTHFINAVVQHKDLAKVSVIRICGPVSHELPPFCDFPTRLAETIRGSTHLVSGGYKYDGVEKVPFDEDEFRNVIKNIREQKISNIAVIGIFSPVRHAQELRAREIVMEFYPEATVSLSHEIGDIGLLQRENATILNECLKPLCSKTVNCFQEAFDSIGIDCPFYLTQNDGTVITSKDVLNLPVRTFASGSTNSMQGAAFLSAKKDAIVVDIGGTTCDVGILKSGFPREASTRITVAGVKTNFRMPDVISIGLGGGSYVTEKKGEDGKVIGVEVGPCSAGYNLKNEALVYNDSQSNEGRTLTATDIAVASGFCDLGFKDNVAHLDKDFVRRALDKIHTMLENVVDGIKLKQEDIPVIVVGGGSILIDTKRPFRGASELIIPPHFGVANAIGAALSKVSASLDTMVNLMNLIDVEQMDLKIKEAKECLESSSDRDIKCAVDDAKNLFYKRAREQAMEKVCERAKSEVIRLGANENDVEILEKADSVLAYIEGRVNIKVKVVGEMKQKNVLSDGEAKQWMKPEAWKQLLEIKDEKRAKQSVTSTGAAILPNSSKEDEDATQHPKDPFIQHESGEWILSEWDIECLAVGSGIYGCGGGGSIHLGRIRALKALRSGKRIRVIRHERLLKNCHPEKDLVFVVGMLGSPSVFYETGAATQESAEAVKCLKEVYDIGRFEDGKLVNSEGVQVEEDAEGCQFITHYNPDVSDSDKKEDECRIIGLTSFEFAGCNAMEPLLLAADMDLPLIDSDGMTRAFPSLDMYIPFMYGKLPYPLSMVGTGNLSERGVLLYTPENKFAEYYLRDVSIKHGCLGHVALALTKAEVETKAAPDVVSSAWRLGDAVLRARLEKRNVIDAIVEKENGKHVIVGKIVDVKRETSGGFNIGDVVIHGVEEWSDKKIEIEFQNEYLVVFPLEEDGSRGTSQGCVPDLICIVDSETGEPITAEELRYGMVVAVVLLPSCELLRRPEALKYVGPRAYRSKDDVSFVPWKERTPVQPVPPL